MIKKGSELSEGEVKSIDAIIKEFNGFIQYCENKYLGEGAPLSDHFGLYEIFSNIFLRGALSAMASQIYRHEDLKVRERIRNEIKVYVLDMTELYLNEGKEKIRGWDGE